MASIGAKVVVAVSNAARKAGKSLDKLGANLEVAKYTERLVPSTRFVSVDGIAPVVSEAAAFVAPSANIIGDVEIGKDSSVWYGATIRADGNKVTIGTNTSIGDRALVHIATLQSQNATTIGSNVTVGPSAIIHAATLRDNCIIGPMAQVLDGATVGERSVLSAGAVLGMGKSVPDGELWGGCPAVKIRELSLQEMDGMGGTVSAGVGDGVSIGSGMSVVAEDVRELALLHAVECGKDYKSVMEDEEKWLDDQERNPDYFQPKPDEDHGDVQGMGSPGRIFDTTLSHPIEGLKRKAEQK